MGLKLTKKQKRILDFISDFEEEKGILNRRSVTNSIVSTNMFTSGAAAMRHRPLAS